MRFPESSSELHCPHDMECLEGKVQTLNSDLQVLLDLPQAATPLLFSEYPTFLCSSN